MCNADSGELRDSNVTARRRRQSGRRLRIRPNNVSNLFRVQPSSPTSGTEIYLENQKLGRIQQLALDANRGTPLDGEVTRLFVEVQGGRIITFVYTVSRDLTDKEYRRT